jgi:hypothetical protein
MTDYLFLLRGGTAEKEKMSPEEMQQHTQKCITWIEKLTREGVYKGGKPLDRSGKTVRGKKATVTDGPYAESKDLIGGYCIIQAASYAKAAEIAKGCPVFEFDGSVEIREISTFESK